MKKQLNWSERITPCDETNVKKFAPEKSGVYLLWVAHEKKGWVISYVGQAENLKKRLLQHLSPDEKNECIKNKLKYKSAFSFAVVENASERDGIELYIYNKLKPECNKISPPENHSKSEAIEVNIPE